MSTPRLLPIKFISNLLSTIILLKKTIIHLILTLNVFRINLDIVYIKIDLRERGKQKIQPFN